MVRAAAVSTGVMGFIDRTPEFRQLISELTARGESPKVDLGTNAAPQQAQSELNVWSADIGTGIHNTSMKVQELRKLAKKRETFTSQTAHIQELTCSVKEDIQMLNNKIEMLERKAGGGSNRNQQLHSKNMVDTLKTRLLEVTKEFKDALEIRTKALEQQDKQRQQYHYGKSSAANPYVPKQQRPAGNKNDLEGGGGGAQAMAVDQSYHHSRVEAVANVQKTIGELGQMFSKMAVLVTAQEEMIQRIDSDLDNTISNVDDGQQHLLKYFQYVSSNRALIMKVFLILISFVIFFVVFLA